MIENISIRQSLSTKGSASDSSTVCNSKSRSAGRHLAESLLNMKSVRVASASPKYSIIFRSTHERKLCSITYTKIQSDEKVDESNRRKGIYIESRHSIPIHRISE